MKKETINNPRHATMEEHTTKKLVWPEEIETEDPLTELLRKGARKLIQQAVEAELEELLARYAEERDERGRRAVVRNGYLPERTILTGIGPVRVKIPKVRSRKKELSVVFRSVLVPPYVRRARQLDVAIPWLYLKGISSGQMLEALEVLVGPEAKGLSSGVVSRLKRQWETEYREWCQRDLSQDRWVYLWADGIYSGLRAEGERLCVLVIVGVNEQGEKHFLAIEEGVRESKQSWREVLLDLKRRGLEQAPKLAIGDGALGFWAALEEVYPETRHQRCWVHKTANVLNYLPKSLHSKAKRRLQAIWMAENRAEAEKALESFVRTYESKYPKATGCLKKDREALLTFYDFPAEHWVSIRTTNPIESTFATIRHRTRQTRGCLSRNTMLAMLFKLAQGAEKRWHRLRGFRVLEKVIQGVPFQDGVEIAKKNFSPRKAA